VAAAVVYRAAVPPVERRVAVNGITLALFEWGAEQRGRGDSILLVHATGFHARCWDRVVGYLGARHVLAVDQRGHGRSDKVYPVRWTDFGRDLAELVRVLDVREVVGVGHSMGGHAMTDAAAASAAGRFRRLVLIDPVIVAPEAYAEPAAMPWSGEMHPAAKRRNRWDSADEMFARFKDRPPFDTWDVEVLRDYCRWGLLPDPEGGGWVLACPPEYEASIYMTHHTNAGVHASARAIDVPVLVVRVMEPRGGAFDYRHSPTWPGLVRQFKHGREIHLDDRTHFLPMEDPALVAGYVLADD
jgi:lipase